MRLVKNRQCRLLSRAFFFAALPMLFGEKAGDSPVAHEVETARAQAAALALHGANAEEWAKLSRAFGDLAARHPRDPSVRRAHADFLWDRHERERAIDEWEAAEQLAPQDAAVLAQLADAHLALGRGQQSAQYFQKACDSAPTDARLRHAAGTTLFLFRHELVDELANEAQIVARALDHLAAATRLAPQSAEYARAYAETFYGAPRPDWPAALAAWEHYRAVSPDRDFAHANLARVRLKMGHLDAARAELENIHGAGFQGLKENLRRQIDKAAAGEGRD
jgi:predicted Zn-dependent protease